MTEEAKEARRKYMERWRKAHPEKQKEYTEAYWEKVAQRMKDEDDPCDAGDLGEDAAEEVKPFGENH